MLQLKQLAESKCNRIELYYVHSSPLNTLKRPRPAASSTRPPPPPQCSLGSNTRPTTCRQGEGCDDDGSGGVGSAIIDMRHDDNDADFHHHQYHHRHHDHHHH